jgi:hypothetical protein
VLRTLGYLRSSSKNCGDSRGAPTSGRVAAGLSGAALIERTREISERAEQVSASLRDCVDRLGLPRWPFDR